MTEKRSKFKIDKADKMRRRNFFSKMEVTVHENKVRAISSNKNRVEILRHVTVIIIMVDFRTLGIFF